MFSLNNITKIFKSDLLVDPFVALKDVSFSVPEGAMVGFLGANGAGKTTSLKIVLDFIRPTSGSVSFHANLGASKEEIKRNIGYLPERPYFYQHLTGIEFACFMGELSGLSRKEVIEKTATLAQRFRLDHAINRELKTYSKGMLQRIGFLVTLLHEPKLILLDEPLSGLDPVGRKELKDIMAELKREGRTVFFSTHIVSDVEEICDRVVFLNKGELSYNGPVKPLLDEHMKQTWRILIPDKTNFSSSFVAQRKNLGAGIELLEVESQHKDLVVKQVVAEGISIIGIEQEKIRLEEIFYKTGRA
jgi:ABC-2 type transport system ATP-binding protein